ncbi:MAG: ABC transporter substrate-binding protein [Bacilli bacterium]
MKKHVIMSLAALSLVVPMTSCSNSDLYTIGILEYITQDALEAVRNGFVSQLKEKGYEDGKNISIQYQNPEANASTQTTMASKLARECDLVFGIATLSAVALKTAVDDASKDIPVVYSACTDPVGAGLITSVTDHANVIGTSDAGPTKKNIELFTKFKDADNHDIEKIGIIYSTAESNSIVQFHEAQAACSELGITLIDGGFSDSTMINSTVNNLISQGIKGLFVPTDNAAAASMVSIKDSLISNKILTVCADEGETKNGGSLGYSVSYSNLGKTTGDMVASLISGTDIADITCSYSSSFPLVINEDFFTETGIVLPDEIPDNVSMN